MSEGCDGGEDLLPRGGNVILVLEEDSNSGRNCIAYIAKDIAATVEVGSIRGAPNVQGKAMEHMRGIAVTGRAAIDVGNGRLGSGAVRAKGHGREFGEAGDTGDAEVVELEKAVLVEMTAPTMDEVSTCGSDNTRGVRVMIRGDMNLGEAVSTDEVNREAGGVAEEIPGCSKNAG